MVNYDRIKSEAKKQGITLSFLCKKIGMYATYISDLRNKGLDIPQDRLEDIARILNCSVHYLKNETDERIDDSVLDYVNEIDVDILEKAGDLYHAKMIQEERNRVEELSNNKNTDQKEKPSVDGELDELDHEIIKLFSSLSDEKKKAALNYIAFLTQQENGEN